MYTTNQWGNKQCLGYLPIYWQLTIKKLLTCWNLNTCRCIHVFKYKSRDLKQLDFICKKNSIAKRMVTSYIWMEVETYYAYMLKGSQCWTAVFCLPNKNTSKFSLDTSLEPFATLLQARPYYTTLWFPSSIRLFSLLLRSNFLPLRGYRSHSIGRLDSMFLHSVSIISTTLSGVNCPISTCKSPLRKSRVRTCDMRYHRLPDNENSSPIHVRPFRGGRIYNIRAHWRTASNENQFLHASSQYREAYTYFERENGVKRKLS